ncbi:MAG: OmpA family protein [Campylobacterales bacterium]|nr:OmpA family protein [Campylobacterales bacterium]
MLLYGRSLTLSTVTAAFLFTGCATVNPAYAPRYQSDQEVMQQKEKNVVANTGGAALLGGLIGLAIGDKKGAMIGAALGGLVGYALTTTYNKELENRKAQIALALKRHNVNAEKVRMSSITQAQASQETFDEVTTALQKNNKSGEEVVIGQKVVFEDGGQFATDKHTLNQESEAMFREVARAYAKSNNKVMIVGHTDERGSDAHNQGLSERRAKTVATLFKEEGVPVGNIYFMGKGESAPIAANTTVEGRSKNRRVEIVDMPREQDLAAIAYEQKPIQEGFLSAQKASPGSGTPKEPSSAPMGSDSGEGEAPFRGGLLGGAMGGGAFPAEIASGGIKGDLALNAPSSPTPTTTGGEPVSFGVPSYNAYEMGAGRKVLSQESVCVNNASDQVYFGNALPTLAWQEESVSSEKESLHAAILKESGQAYDPKILAQSFVAYANADNVSAIGVPCYYDIKRNSGLLKRLSDGSTVSPTKTAFSSGYESTSLYAQNGSIDIVNVSINRKTFNAAACPMVRINNPEDGKLVYATTSKVVTIGTERGILYRVHPDDKSVFQCADLVLPHHSSTGVATGVFYHVEGDKVWGLPIQLKIDNSLFKN